MSTSPPRHPKRFVITVLVGLLSLSLLPTGALAQADDGAVTGLTAEQEDGFTILRWDPLPGAGQYEIERTPVDADDEPTGPGVIVGLWRPDRLQFTLAPPETPSFADAGFEPGGRFSWRVRPLLGTGLPNLVTIHEPSPAAGSYEANGASFGPAPDETGISGDLVVVNASSGTPSEGCEPLVDFPQGAIAVADRGGCTFVIKARNAQDAGAVALIVVNNVGGAPTNMGGTAPDVTIPSVMVSEDDGATIKDGLPASGTVQSNPPGEFSEPVVGTTLPPSGPDEFLTQWETTGAAEWTSHENEIDFADRLAEASSRMRVETIGHTVLGRRIDMYILGHPGPLASAAEISRSPTVMLNCNVHGNEPAGREACLIATRDLALSNDPRVIDLLTNATVLVVPAINGDGRAANTRGNSTGQDLNRDHSLLRQPETFAFAEALRDYTPDAAVDGHEFGNANTGDLPLLWPRHRNVSEAIHGEAQSLIREFMFGNAAVDGWWTVPYPYPSVGGAGLGQETILRNTLGLKNVIGMLLESRVQPGPTRPNAGGNQGVDNIRRRVYSHLWTYRELLQYHRERRSDVYDAVVAGREFNLSNEGPIHLNGAYDAPDNIPIADPPTRILDPAPCGYALTPDQYTQEQPDGPTVQERLDAHGIRAEVGEDRVQVRLNQPLRGLIPLLLDPEATEAPLIDGERLDDCDPPVCPDTIVLAGQDSRVDDRPADGDFCASQLFDDERPWPNRGAFVQHVTDVSSGLRAAGVLSSRERAALISAAGQS